ncbi:MAG: sulfatase-like hydrolase/transferase [Myxococcota bacterium]
MILAVALAGCHQQRVADLEQHIATLKTEVDRLNAEAATLRTQLASRPPPTASIRVDNDPPGFDASKPLPAGNPQRPDVIVLSIDTLRADHLGTYGYARPTSPNLDALGQEGTVFEDAWSPTSWTLPSHTTMLSSWLPIHHGTIEDHLKISSDVPLLQESFRSAGYGTVGVVSTLFVSSRFGFDRGFDHFEDFGIRSKRENNLSTVTADQVFHHALDWSQKQPDGKPLFLFLHVYDAHYQYDPPAPWNEKFDRKPQWGDEVYRNYEAYKKRMIPQVQLDHQLAQYDEEIAYIDAMFGEFLTRWRSERPALVIVTADHGEEFGERGSWGHAHTLWPEQLHVPLIVNGPGVVAQRRPDRVGTEDIAATVAELAGIPFANRDGLSRAPEIRTGVAPTTDHVAGKFADTSRFDTIAVRWHEGAFDLQIDVAEGQRSLCKVDEDKTCKVNVYRQYRTEAEAMFDHLVAWLGDPWEVSEAGTVEARDGVIYVGNDRKNQTAEVYPGDKFSVMPGDAKVRFQAEGRTFGPWQPLGGTTPGNKCPVAFTGRATIGTELPELSAGESEMLEALGYLQGDPEAEDPAEAVGATGPTACD